MIKQLCNRRLGPEGSDHNLEFKACLSCEYYLCNKCIASYFSLRRYIDTNWDEEVNSFEEMGLKAGIVENFP